MPQPFPDQITSLPFLNAGTILSCLTVAWDSTC